MLDICKMYPVDCLHNCLLLFKKRKSGHITPQAWLYITRAVKSEASGPYAIWWSHLATWLPASRLCPLQPHGPLNVPSLVLLGARLCCPLCVECSFPSSRGSISSPSHFHSPVISSEGTFWMALSKAAAVCFATHIYLFCFLDCTCKGYHTVFLCLISLSIIFSRSNHTAANGRILFLLYS